MWLKLAAIALLILLYWVAWRGRSDRDSAVERRNNPKQPPRPFNMERKDT